MPCYVNLSVVELSQCEGIAWLIVAEKQQVAPDGGETKEEKQEKVKVL